jgi:hypothetical protein
MPDNRKNPFNRPFTSNPRGPRFTRIIVPMPRTDSSCKCKRPSALIARFVNATCAYIVAGYLIWRIWELLA